MWIIVTAVSRTTFLVKGSQSPGHSQCPARPTPIRKGPRCHFPNAGMGPVASLLEGLGSRE
jgi:hypothetical protein